MKYLIVTLFLLISFLGFGQSVSAPDSKSFIPSTTGQDASGFILSGFTTTDVILASISLVEYPTGTTFYLGTTTGLTAASGFTLTGNKVRLVVTGSIDNINTALTSLKVNTGATKGNVKLSVAATINPTGYYYNGVNGHFYKPVTATADRTTYTNARARSLLSTFKGQQGYLVTITSASEDAFIFANVPATNVWFAATDEVIDGRWVIDAGPEKGTVMKTSNGQLNGNIAGVYNNWAGGEPNGSNHSEDYAVAKWNGATTWNDLNNNWANPYVIEYGTWINPDDATFTEFYTNSTTHSNGDVLTARFNFDFGGNVDETKFSAKANTYVNNIWGTTTNTLRALSGLGKVDITNDLDTAKISSGGIKASTTAGQIEWCVIYGYDSYNKRYRIGIDSREVTGIVSDPSTISNLQLFDLYNGPVTFNSYDPNGWTEVYVYTETQFNFSASSYQSNIRNGGGYYALRAEFTFSSTQSFKQHGIELIANSQTELNNLYNNIVTVSDVYLAFKELSNGGIFGNQTGLEFGNGIQYLNADVDGNGVFNESDTYKLLQHLTGVAPLTQYSALTYLMKLYSKTDYDAITKSNWNTQFNSTRSLYPFNLNSGVLNNTYNLNVTWLGDVNLSHSAQQTAGSVASNSLRTMSLTTNSLSNVEADIMMEKNGDSVIATIKLNSNGNEIGATQFDVYFDNSILDYVQTNFNNTSSTNFSKNTGSLISLGTLNTSNGSIGNMEYKVTFKSKINLTNILGLISVKNVETIDTKSNKLNIKII